MANSSMEAATGKRSDFARLAGDFYETPFEAVPPLLPFLGSVHRYIEPCCGHRALIEHLGLLLPQLRCVLANDLEFGFDAIALKPEDVKRLGADCIISNVPWTRALLHPMIEHFAGLAPTWLLFDADWAFTKQSALLMPLCSDIVAVGRVRWIRDSPHTSKDSAAWYRFDCEHQGTTKFHGRAP